MRSLIVENNTMFVHRVNNIHQNPDMLEISYSKLKAKVYETKFLYKFS
ncbi:hypothetical protein FDUTEX481_04905 [Tolypothrix sp. PCC 7601]|nr:hypothetical protein FDUTEX481_04905 [Tolypothrix sp. PCC 7601]